MKINASELCFANTKYENLLACIAKKGKVAVAFSGGVDSSFLCYAAYDALGKNAIAVTITSPMLSKSEFSDAKKIAEQIGIEHVLIEEKSLDEHIAKNPKDRCYFCKKKGFSKITQLAKERGINTVLDGTNIDDEKDYRPGLKAVLELKISSPLRETGFSKSEIRELLRLANIPVWNKPAFACLASRIPYGQEITTELLHKIEAGEEILHAFGFESFRLRVHNNIARIEVAKSERNKFFSEQVLDEISKKIKSLGFTFVAMELEGYEMGNLNF
ncbi:MAG: ATP-dependent sacrificial sulfur transferase LarE [Fibromonadaceae bacterium]|jgi:uncharacterized protein|nr:ATP-dependent sacrificial sulfur transferase LarE [Fibromonadaceae bacterium]